MVNLVHLRISLCAVIASALLLHGISLSIACSFFALSQALFARSFLLCQIVPAVGTMDVLMVCNGDLLTECAL